MRKLLTVATSFILFVPGRTTVEWRLPQPVPHSAICPNPAALSTAYAAALTVQRRSLDPHARRVQLDPGLLPETLSFAQHLSEVDSLFHANTRFAELCGTLDEYKARPDEPPRRLAAYILARLTNSLLHDVIQKDTSRIWIAAAAAGNYYVVRLCSTRRPKNPGRRPGSTR